MARVRVVTDSTADMDPDEAHRLGIVSVPLNVHWNGLAQKDKEEISIDEFYRKLREEKGTPRTSQPSSGEFELVYRDLLSESDAVISLHISSKLSGTFNSARVAAEHVSQDRIAIMDSFTTTYPLGLIAIRVAQLARDGGSLRECVDLAYDLIPRSRLIAAVDTLEYLRRGGRIGRAQALAGGLLSIKLVFQVEDGEVVPVDRVRTRAVAIKRTADAVRAFGPLEQLSVLYGDDPEPARQLLSLLNDAYPELQIAWGRIGPVLGSHTGPGVIGAGVLLAR